MTTSPRRALLWLGALAILPAHAAAQDADARVAAAVERFAPAIVEARHRIHQEPELGNREFRTAERVA
ncbi:MAG TPA: hypothetical protein VHG51_17665, partial [Longimicrobiaceae bacterium]|nr:hypothetical protein [Longimicrobiaceae bacterium]